MVVEALLLKVLLLLLPLLSRGIFAMEAGSFCNSAKVEAERNDELSSVSVILPLIMAVGATAITGLGSNSKRRF